MFQVMYTTWIPIPSIFVSKFVSNPIRSCSSEKMAPLSRFEVSRPEMVEANPRVATLFDKIGQGLFFKSFSGHHYDITKKLSISLREFVA